jgi:exopolysaccharide biosynthesis WecB/TagA/CpsF family protein
MAAARAQQPFGAAALAVHGLMEARRDPAYRARLNSLDLTTPDGQPVRWALNSLHATGLADRVYGPFLMLHVCESAARERLPVFFFGGTADTLRKLSAALLQRYPGLIIAGTKPSRFSLLTAEEAVTDAREITASGARLVFCGLGCPRQENWVHAMRPLVNAPLLAVGAAFPLWAGERRMAPGWMQRGGLEWIFRLGQEPRRLLHRYLVFNPWFVLCWLRQKLNPSAYPLIGPEAPPVYPG